MSTPPHEPGDHHVGLGGVCANHPTNPATAICHRCGDFICGYCLRPSDTGQPTCPRCYSDTSEGYRELAWEHPEEFGGPAAAFVHTLKRSMLAPSTFFTTVDPSGGYRAPILYALLCFGFVMVGSLASQAAQVAVVPEADEIGTLIRDSPGIAVGIGLGVLVLVPVFAVLGQFMMAGFIHVAAMVVGAANEGYEATFRVVNYAQGPQVLTGVVSLLVALLGVWHPVLFAILSALGGLVNMGVGFYFYVLIAYGIRDVHGTTMGRAIGTIGVLIGGSILLVCLTFALVMGLTMGAVGASSM